MAKFIVWIILAIVAVVLAVWIFNYVREEAQPLTTDPAMLERIGTGNLDPDDLVLVTLDDGVIHQPRCPMIDGTTEKMLFRAANRQEFRTCEVCIDLGE